MTAIDDFLKNIETTRFKDWDEVKHFVGDARWYHNFVRKEDWIMQDLCRQVRHGYKTYSFAIMRMRELERMARNIHDFILEDVSALAKRLTKDSSVTTEEYQQMDRYVLEVVSSYLRES